MVPRRADRVLAPVAVLPEPDNEVGKADAYFLQAAVAPVLRHAGKPGYAERVERIAERMTRAIG